MSKIVVDYGNSASGGNIPFELAPYETRVTINSQNNYIYNDNGTAKAHISVSITARQNVSTNYGIMMDVPIMTSADITVTSGNTQYQIAASSGYVYFRTKSASLTSGQTYTIECDYTL